MLFVWSLSTLSSLSITSPLSVIQLNKTSNWSAIEPGTNHWNRPALITGYWGSGHAVMRMIIYVQETGLCSRTYPRIRICSTARIPSNMKSTVSWEVTISKSTEFLDSRYRYMYFSICYVLRSSTMQNTLLPINSSFLGVAVLWVTLPKYWDEPRKMRLLKLSPTELRLTRVAKFWTFEELIIYLC